MLKKAKEIGVIQVFYGLFFGWLVHQVILFASPESDSNYFQEWFDLQGFIEKANIVRARDLPYFAGDCWPMVVSYFFYFFFLWENQVFFFLFSKSLISLMHGDPVHANSHSNNNNNNNCKCTWLYFSYQFFLVGT